MSNKAKLIFLYALYLIQAITIFINGFNSKGTVAIFIVGILATTGLVFSKEKN